MDSSQNSPPDPNNPDQNNPDIPIPIAPVGESLSFPQVVPVDPTKVPQTNEQKVTTQLKNIISKINPLKPEQQSNTQNQTQNPPPPKSHKLRLILLIILIPIIIISYLLIKRFLP